MSNHQRPENTTHQQIYHWAIQQIILTTRIDQIEVSRRGNLKVYHIFHKVSSILYVIATMAQEEFDEFKQDLRLYERWCFENMHQHPIGLKWEHHISEDGNTVRYYFDYYQRRIYNQTD